MIPTGKNVDKLASTLLYIALIGLVSWGGVRIINYSLEARFYRDYLIKWDIAVMSYSVKGDSWPHFTGSNHVEYMDSLVSSMSRGGVFLPKANTDRTYIYRIRKIVSPEEIIFVLCLQDSIILYGISENTFERIDSHIDGKVDKRTGKFTGKRSADGKAYVGRWRL